MLKRDRLVCEKNATKAQPVTNCNLGSINSVYFNSNVNLLIVRGRIFVTELLCGPVLDLCNTFYFSVNLVVEVATPFYCITTIVIG